MDNSSLEDDSQTRRKGDGMDDGDDEEDDEEEDWRQPSKIACPSIISPPVMQSGQSWPHNLSSGEILFSLMVYTYIHKAKLKCMQPVK